MGKHRKAGHYRRIAIAAVAVGAVGVPTAALACVDWRDGGDRGTHTTAKTSTPVSWDHTDGQGRRPAAADGSATPSATPTPSASTSKPAAPKRKPSTKKTSAPHPRASRTTSTPSAPKTSSPVAAAPAPRATASSATARVVELVNAERAKAGCSALTVSPTLAKVAQAHSEDMAAHRNMSHTGSDGSSPGDRITRAGYDWSSYGENVAYGYATPEQVMEGWMASPGHRENILNCSFKQIGVGLAQPDSYWTQDFGTAQ
ncbi:CAP domain-containing protein [Streptomyces sp. NPDC052040]|uniref:CAP domain-containing protein n=1 Tax=Streptomyces sp. NPDC052040 TaxID=3365682 RepID=UPI0037CF23CF